MKCPLYDVKKRTSFQVRIGHEVFTECPIWILEEKEIKSRGVRLGSQLLVEETTVDIEDMLQDALSAYSMSERGFLPDGGAYLHQTEFFIEATKIVKLAVQEKEREIRKKMEAGRK